MKRITFIADTHAQHDKNMAKDLPGGDFLIHAGDFTNRGYLQEVKNFCDWYNVLNKYEHKIFIAGNHELGMEEHPDECAEIIRNYPNITYLQDELIEIDGIKIYGTPWQPKFFEWAFNLDRNGEELKEKWDLIPEDTDILITHGPPFGILDVQSRGQHMGCELLYERVNIVKPKIHVFGHNHFAYGDRYIDGTLYINAAVLDQKYRYTKTPTTIDWDEKTGNYFYY
jgi:Icc-related predicted phosphoesterase